MNELWMKRAPTLILVCIAALLAMATVRGNAEHERRRVQAAESSARAQWVQVYWQRRQARALDAACDPAWMDQ